MDTSSVDGNYASVVSKISCLHKRPSAAHNEWKYKPTLSDKQQSASPNILISYDEDNMINKNIKKPYNLSGY
ncbi:hypothetical protein KHA93_13170 [Bacillus sp. FJAT-49732]|uniref:Uncharacterized protein n=1 Tax=Lederbergia citrisecunda TaxID=2833583 RepID=A0A942YKN3_9BACI|nr:hypothetical protein [Lederbergia citrisecunda]MBS4200583.1 hypothetical protein [Lederbergia citrisecunda]